MFEQLFLVFVISAEMVFVSMKTARPLFPIPSTSVHVQEKRIAPITEADHIRGNPKAKVFLVEYTDLECPFCQRHHPVMKQLKEHYGSDVAWVYRHMPLTTIHPHAQKEAEATECAFTMGGNDAFWKYVDGVFEKTGETGVGLNADALSTLAEEQGLDRGTFRTCVDGRTMRRFVTKGSQDATRVGIYGTPSTIVLTRDGKYKQIDGAVPYENFTKVIDEFLQ